jgi:hypothetical protein
MELPIYISTKANLINAYWGDIISSDGVINSNKIFFLKDQIKNEFYSTYLPYDNDWIYKSEIDILVEKHAKEEINYLVNKRLIYMLSTTLSSNNFEFKLYLKKAETGSLFYNTRRLKQNTIYYVVDKSNGNVIGPEFTKYDSDVQKFKELIEKGLVYVPTNKQTFEPFKVTSIAS